jgi:hypothetical protein
MQRGQGSWKRRNALRRHIGRQVRNHLGDVPAEQRRTVSWIQRLFAAVTEADPAGSGQTAAATWDEAAERYGYTADRLQRNYRHWALLTRIMLCAALGSLIILLHRLVLRDWSSALASFGALLLLLGFALKPAHRCWMIRYRTLGRPIRFLARPCQWWPVELPADYQPRRSRRIQDKYHDKT